MSAVPGAFHDVSHRSECRRLRSRLRDDVAAVRRVRLVPRDGARRRVGDASRREVGQARVPASCRGRRRRPSARHDAGGLEAKGCAASAGWL